MRSLLPVFLKIKEHFMISYKADVISKLIGSQSLVKHFSATSQRTVIGYFSCNATVDWLASGKNIAKQRKICWTLSTRCCCFWFGYWEVAGRPTSRRDFRAYARLSMGWSVRAEIGTFAIPKVRCRRASVLSQVKTCSILWMGPSSGPHRGQ